MSNLTFFMRCPGCGAKNRVRLVSGKKLRVRCGSCGEPLPLDKKRVFSLAAWQWIKAFFSDRLPKILLALVNAFYKVAGALLAPAAAVWRRLPLKARKRLSWTVLAVLVVIYLVVENTLKLGSLLALVLLLALAMVAVLLAARGPLAVREMFGRVIRKCPSCGHRYLGWLKGCPRCGG